MLLEDDPSTPLDEAHKFEPHYELHAWLFRDNPLGTFAPFNPNVTCRHHKATAAQPIHAAAHAEAAAVPAIGADEARAMLASGALLIDVRESDELRESGWLEGAVHRPMSTFGKQAEALPNDRPIILYCRSGRRSQITGDILRSLGFSQVYSLGSYRVAAQSGWPTAGT